MGTLLIRLSETRPAISLGIIIVNPGSANSKDLYRLEKDRQSIRILSSRITQTRPVPPASECFTRSNKVNHVATRNI